MSQPENEKVYSLGDYVAVCSETTDWFMCVTSEINDPSKEVEVRFTLLRRGRFDRFRDLIIFPVQYLIYGSVLYMLCAQRSYPRKLRARSRMALRSMLATRILGFWDASLCEGE